MRQDGGAGAPDLPMEAFPQTSRKAMPPSVDTMLRRQKAALQALRRLSPMGYVLKTAGEGAAAAAVASPAFLVFYFLDGMVQARYPRVTGTKQAPRTMGALLSAGLKNSLGNTLRTSLFVAATAGCGAAFREVARVGPRYEDNAMSNPLFHAANFASGAVCAVGATAGWGAALSGVRRGGFVLLGGVAGAFLPFWLATYGPLIRARMLKLLPEDVASHIADASTALLDQRAGSAQGHDTGSHDSDRSDGR